MAIVICGGWLVGCDLSGFDSFLKMLLVVAVVLA